MRTEQIKSVLDIQKHSPEFSSLIWDSPAAGGERTGEGLQPEDAKWWYRTHSAAPTPGRQGGRSGAWLLRISVNHCIRDSVLKYDLRLYFVWGKQ